MLCSLTRSSRDGFADVNAFVRLKCFDVLERECGPLSRKFAYVTLPDVNDSLRRDLSCS